MIPNLFLDPDFLTIEQSAQFIGIPADIVLSLIEEYPFPTAVAIPSTPMVLVPEGKDDTMRMVFSNPEQYGDELKKWTEDQAGTFKVHPNAIKSVAINGSTSINKIWSLIPEDKNIRIDHLSEDEQNILKRRCYWLRQPIEISLSNIRIPLHFIKILHTLNDGRRKIIEIEESRKEQQQKEKPLHASERNTLLSIIRALAELSGIKKGNGAYRKEAEELLLRLAKNGIKEPCNDKTLAKHLENAFVER